MKRILTPILLAVCIAALSAQPADAQKRRKVDASNNYITRELGDPGPFDEIRISGFGDVEFRQTTGPRAVSIYGADNILQYLRVERSGNRLEVSTDTKNVDIRGRHRLKVYVSGPGIVKATSSGASDITIKGPLRASTLLLDVSGAGDIEFESIECDKLSIRMSGAGDIEGRRIKAETVGIEVSGAGDVDIDDIAATGVKVSVKGAGDVDVAGKTVNASYTVSGSADISAGALRAEHVTATVSGVGEISCYAGKSLKASTSGMGSIVYDGNPAEVDIKGRNPGIRRK